MTPELVLAQLRHSLGNFLRPVNYPATLTPCGRSLRTGAYCLSFAKSVASALIGLVIAGVLRDTLRHRPAVVIGGESKTLTLGPRVRGLFASGDAVCGGLARQ